MLNRRCIFLTEGVIKFLSWRKLASEQGVNQGDVAGQGSSGEGLGEAGGRQWGLIPTQDRGPQVPPDLA